MLTAVCPRSWFPLARHLGCRTHQEFLKQAVWTENQHMARIDKRRRNNGRSPRFTKRGFMLRIKSHSALNAFLLRFAG